MNLSMVFSAADRIAPHIHCTPVLTSRTLDKQAGKYLHFKCENLQKAGSFKFRGALNAVQQLQHETRPVVVTHSSGNHAQALALAAKVTGLQAVVVMPRTASQCKKNAVLGYGGSVVDCDPTYQAREEMKNSQITQLKASGRTAEYISSSQDVRIIAGQGTVALEMIDEVKELDGIIAPVGGGGLLGGVAFTAKSMNPQMKVIAAEPVNAADCYNSVKSGHLQPLTSCPSTIADGLKVSVGEVTWPYIKEYVDDVILVGEQEIKDAMRLVWERMKLVIEPSAAVAVSAALTQQFRDQYRNLQHVGVILSGGNCDLNNLPWVVM
jgi:threonine dehydratase